MFKKRIEKQRTEGRKKQPTAFQGNTAARLTVGQAKPSSPATQGGNNFINKLFINFKKKEIMKKVSLLSVVAIVAAIVISP